MARTKNTPVELTPDTPLDAVALDEAREQHDSRMQVVLAQFGDGLPFDQERLIHEAQFYMQQSAEAALQVGRRLVVLKEAAGHGRFIEIVEERLGINHTTAKRLMQAAVKLTALGGKANGATSHHLIDAVGSKSKLFELMTLDTEDLEALAEGGTVANLTLDDVERMTVTELRAAVREAKENYQAQAGVLSDKNTKIDKLTTELRKVKRRSAEASSDEISGELQEEITRFAFVAEASIAGDLHNGIEALMEHSSMEGRDPRAFLAGILLQLDRRVNDIRVAFDIPLSVDADVRPALAR